MSLTLIFSEVENKNRDLLDVPEHVDINYPSK